MSSALLREISNETQSEPCSWCHGIRPADGRRRPNGQAANDHDYPDDHHHDPDPICEAEEGETADIKTGATVYDLNGGTVGTVKSSDAEEVVVSTGAVRAKLGLSGFGVGDKGLTIAMTRAELDATAKAKPK